MARDLGLEELVAEQLDGVPHVSGKALFGGWCWLVRGHLLCGARHDGLLVRIGQNHPAWAIRHPGIAAMTVGPRPMPGWIRMSPDAFADDALRRRLVDAALAFVATLPDKEGIATSSRTRQAESRKSTLGRPRPVHDPKA